jgi:DNA (cytosine-5)-methyltransferase 1
MSVKPVKVIDLFAGPGGLGEGFASCAVNDNPAFKIAISIEKEESAHRTLLLRALYRQFDQGKVPDAYYAFLRGELGKHPEDQLYQLPELQWELKIAKAEAQRITLGETDPDVVYKKIGEALGDDDCVLIGGPPCQAYSLVGRARNYGALDKQYSATDDHRNFLYLEYLKIIAKFQPKIFVMENVKGMLSAKVDGKLIFESILSDLKDPFKAVGINPAGKRKKHKYAIRTFVSKKGGSDLFDNEGELDPHNFIIRSENYGVPQARHRVILLGIREDVAANLEKLPTFDQSESVTTVEQVISDLPKLRSRLSKGGDSTDNWRNAIVRFQNEGLDQLENDTLVPKPVYENFSTQLDTINSSPETTGSDKGMEKTEKFNEKIADDLKDWFIDDRLGSYVINHESRGHIEGDLHRYLYYSSFAQTMGVSPNSSNLPKNLRPLHNNFNSGKFADRFRVQRANKPGTTVTCHISKDGHYYIHYDPNQCRSLTVREAARIQTFPDNYYFVGNRTQQYVQVGNAVPPFLADKIAAYIIKMLS